MHNVNIASLTPDQLAAINNYEEDFTKKYGKDIVLIAVNRHS
ncbi:MAG: hypothetical protein N2491_05695 [Negativicutes bacterium]|nr:hypothetical protein [Negativicutes bacterium]